jgi:uncharacterized oxidoreductase
MAPMDMTKIVPLVTGGGSGIGLGLVREFLARGSPKVLITGRREQVLAEAAAGHPPGAIAYKVSDAGSASDRQALFDWVRTDHPDCNALVNNAGIQRRIGPADDVDAPWAERAAEIEINFSGPVHLTALFLPHFLSAASTGASCASGAGIAMIVNVSSGLAFVPFAAGPVYSATKAALHSYSMALRYSLTGTSVRLVEIVPPAVKSNLGGSHDFGEDCAEFCAHVMDLLQAGDEDEVGYKFSETARLADRAALDQMMVNVAKQMNVKPFPSNSS